MLPGPTKTPFSTLPATTGFGGLLDINAPHPKQLVAKSAACHVPVSMSWSLRDFPVPSLASPPFVLSLELPIRHGAHEGP